MILVMPARDFIFGSASCWNYFLVTGVSLLGIIAALVVATAIMFLGGMLALMIKLLPWLLLAIAVVWVIKAIKAPKVPKYQRYDRWRY